MKKILSLIMLAAGFLTTSYIYGQDVDINILTVPDSVTLGSTSGVVNVDICNVDGGSGQVSVYKLRPLVSGNPLIMFTGADLPAGWSILSNDGTNILFSNGTDNTLAPGECRHIVIHFTAVMLGTGAVITGTMGFSNGIAPGSGSGPQTTGNFTNNDNSTTTITVIGQPLPVGMVFDAKADGSRALLSWTTSYESGNKGFDIERSTDGRQWAKIGYKATRAPGGNSSAALAYAFTDAQPLPGVNMYRLKQTDADGDFVYSDVHTLNFSLAGGTDISIYPNPATDKVNIVTQHPDQLKEISVADMYGKEVYRSSDLTQAVELGTLPAGVYLFRVMHTDGSVSVFKVTRL